MCVSRVRRDDAQAVAFIILCLAKSQGDACRPHDVTRTRVRTRYTYTRVRVRACAYTGKRKSLLREENVKNEGMRDREACQTRTQEAAHIHAAHSVETTLKG